LARDGVGRHSGRKIGGRLGLQSANREIDVPGCCGGRGFADFSPCVSGRRWIERHFGDIGSAGWRLISDRFMHRPTSVPAAPTGLPCSSMPDYPGPFRGPCGPGKTGEDHTRVGRYETGFKVSRRGHLSVTSVRLNGSGSSIPLQSNTMPAGMKKGQPPARLPDSTVARGFAATG
jgi:hypothetical protein